MQLPGVGRPVADVVADLEAKRTVDVQWSAGRTFGLADDGGPSVHEVAERAAPMYLHDNALNTRAFRAGIASIDGLRVLGDGGLHLVAMAGDDAAADPLDVFAAAEVLARGGWYLDRQGPPDSLHATVSVANVAVVDDYVADVRAAADEVRGRRAEDRDTSYATLE